MLLRAEVGVVCFVVILGFILYKGFGEKCLSSIEYIDSYYRA